MSEPLKVLDLFSGIGGFSLGLERTKGFRTVAFCEIEPFPQRVLAKHWPDVFIHDDIRTLNKDSLCKGSAENAFLNQLCKETGGGSASAKLAIMSIRKVAGLKTPLGTTNGPLSVEDALSNIMAGSVPAAESENTLFWQSITRLTTGTTSDQNTRALFGSSLSSEDYQTIIRFFVTTVTWQNQSTASAHISAPHKAVYNDDVRTLTAERLRADGICVDVICGGFPCQDISVAGKGEGLAGARSGLWAQYARLVRELRPRFVIVENVAALLGRGLDRVLADLAAFGFDAEWHCIPASALGAPHERDRLWVVAYPDDGQRFGQVGAVCPGRHAVGGSREAVADADRLSGAQQQRYEFRFVRKADVASSHFRNRGAADGNWNSEPGMGRVAHGVSNRVDRLRGLGNAVVPQIPELIGNAILASLAQREAA